MWIRAAVIYGIGTTNAKEICEKAEIDSDKITDDLDDNEQQAHPRRARARRLQGRRRPAPRVQLNIKRLMDLGCYRGLRHRKGFRFDGQRTHTNARTRKGPRKGMDQARSRQRAPRPKSSERNEPWPPRRRPAANKPKKAKKARKNVSTGICAYPVDLQQHHRHHHRHQRQRRAWSSRGVARLQGFAQDHAVRRSARRRRGRSQGDGARHALDRRVRQGPGRGPRVRAARSGRRRAEDHADSRRHPHSAQRLPAAQAASRLSLEEAYLPMARYIGPVCKLCRREGMKLFLKGERCYTDKCCYAPPVPAGPARSGAACKIAEYGVRLREKQKVRRIYGLARAPVPRLLLRGDPQEGRDRREPAAASRAPPRQRRPPPGLRRDHARGAPARAPRHVQINGKRVNIPSFLCTPSDKVEVVARSSRKIKRVAGERSAPVDRRGSAAMAASSTRTSFHGHASSALPAREDLTSPIREQLDRRVLLASKVRLGDGSQEIAHVDRESFRRASTDRNRQFDRPQLARPDPARRLEVDAETLTPTLRQVHLRAARARLRHHDRQLAPPRAAVVAAGRGHHRPCDRRRAARVHHVAGRRRGRHRHHPEPQRGRVPRARRRRRARCASRRTARARSPRATSSATDGVEILNPDTTSSTARKGAAARWSSTVGIGRGYVPAERNKTPTMPIGDVPIDALFSPIRKVNLHGHQRPRRSAHRLRQADARGVDQRRGEARGRRRLRGEDPEGAALDLHQLRGDGRAGPGDDGSEEQPLNENLFHSVDELELSVRSANCLQNANIRSSASWCRGPSRRC